ncbi:Trichome birefringence-like, N-terminal domain [Dillenia turbinata]|uniref:Trichome birefringence-like, N-terminal domain n=1 Tax=Dillenia turbinata TaxID=194707 RepID=A0AAN8ZGV3_9MAGN
MGSTKHRTCSVLVVVLSLIFSCLGVAKAEQSQINIGNGRRAANNSCNLYEGSWVWDDSYPPYDFSKCPFLPKDFDCLGHGRPDRNYLKYRWQPNNCNLPRFDGVDFLNRLRGKTIMFVGDSISYEHGQSFICHLLAAVPSLQIIADKPNTVIFKDYEITVILSFTEYLVDIENEQVGRVLKLDSIKNGQIWKDMDILVFNTWLWWPVSGERQPWDYIQDGDQLVKDMDRMEALRKGLTTWAKWVNSDVDPSKTKVYFRGITPVHYVGAEWGDPTTTGCSKETEPVKGSTYPGGLPRQQVVAEEVLKTITTPVTLLDVTTLSQLRKDAHPGAYVGGSAEPDCTHWCIPGLIETWNILLYATLL